MKQSPIWTLAHKELATLFNSAATYVICVVFMVIMGWLFVTPLFQMNQSTLDTFLGPLPLILTFVIPALTMRAFSEEFKAGTIEYLATLPIRDYEVVLAKYLAAVGMVGVLIVFTLVFPLVLFIAGRPDPGRLVGAYLSIIGLGSFFGAIGVWASSLTRNQVVAFIIGFFVCFIFYMLSRMSEFLPGILSSFVRGLSIETHFDALARGVLDSRDLLYWASGTVFFLAASLMSVHARRWR